MEGYDDVEDEFIKIYIKIIKNVFYKINNINIKIKLYLLLLLNYIKCNLPK